MHSIRPTHDAQPPLKWVETFHVKRFRAELRNETTLSIRCDYDLPATLPSDSVEFEVSLNNGRLEISPFSRVAGQPLPGL